MLGELWEAELQPLAGTWETLGTTEYMAVPFRDRDLAGRERAGKRSGSVPEFGCPKVHVSKA
jgi:hypothetical protein